MDNIYSSEKIDYTNFLHNKPQEADPTKLAMMKAALVKALQGQGIHGHISAVYYTDGNIKVSVDGEYYNMFSSTTGNFFSGCVGDY